MSHKQFLQKLTNETKDISAVIPTACFTLNGSKINVYTNDVLRVPCDAIVCGRLTPINPLGVIFKEFWGAGLAWGYTSKCPMEIKRPIDEEVVIPIKFPEITNAKYIGVVYPNNRSMREQLRKTVIALIDELECKNISIIAPTYGEPNHLKCIPASDIVSAIIGAIANRCIQVNLVDEWDSSLYVNELTQQGIIQTSK